jgi:oxalate decarboxylase/phosphoglucose isomerase-like protein (cupin superfamily)
MNTVTDITRESLADLRRRRIPTLIKNGTSEFKNLKKWDKEYIIKKWGKSICSYSDDARPVYSSKRATYENFFNNLYDKKEYTFTRQGVVERGDFLSDFTFPNVFFDEGDVGGHIFFSGDAGTGALPHSHGDALNFMVYGKKKWILFDSSTIVGARLELLYYDEYAKGSLWPQWYEAEYLNLKKTIQTIECTQESGDVVFVPYRYNHSVYNLSSTMGIIIEYKSRAW